jgi:hypothetical protein
MTEPPDHPELSLQELAEDIATIYEHIRSHADHLSSLRQTTLAVDAKLAGLLTRQAPAVQVFRWENLPDTEREEKRAAFTAWVNTVASRYGYDEIPGCPSWWDHDALVEELTALWISWTGAYMSGAHPTEPLRWHEALHRARDRIVDLRGGCTSAEHHAADRDA